jgi:PKHD-type hydroxylase
MWLIDRLQHSEFVSTPPPNTRGNCVSPVLMRSAFTPEECERALGLVEGLPLGKGALSVDVVGMRDTSVAWIQPSEDSRWLFAKCAKVGLNANEHFGFALAGLIEPLQYARYELEQHFGWHTDTLDGISSTRKLSFSLLLSARSEYFGGDLEFMPHSSTSNLCERGDVIAFPSFCAHRVTPVTRGRRHALTWWVHGDCFR